MSGPMGPKRLAHFRADLARDGTYSTEVYALLVAHDYHSKRADEAEASLTEAAGRLLDEGEPAGLRVKVLDLAAKWIAIGGGGRDKRDQMCDVHGRELRSLASVGLAPPETPSTTGLRGLLDDAETERDCYRAKLIALMGVDDFESWRAMSGLVDE